MKLDRTAEEGVSRLSAGISLAVLTLALMFASVPYVLCT